MNMPPRWGFSPFEVDGYNYVAPLELKRTPMGSTTSMLSLEFSGRATSEHL